jgi:hypothetical protein
MRNPRNPRSPRRTIAIAAAVAFVGAACGLLASMPDQPDHVGLVSDPISAGADAGLSNQLAGTFGTGIESNPVCTPTRLASAQTLVEQYLSNRATQLGILSTRISNTKSIPASDVSSLQSIVSNEQTTLEGGGIAGLETTVRSATTCLQVISDARTMIVDFRVFAVVSPQVDLTAVASLEQAIITKATALEPKIQSAITAAQQRGVNVYGAQTAYAGLASEIADAQNEVSQVSISSLIAQQPSSYPGDTATLVGYHEDVASAGVDLRAAYEDAMTIVGVLKS